ncbi:MAG TPA: hypothetical protein VGO92_06260 [Acidimicrobiales bacterium]|nr:hypothetical protein [Acidimicrobiales bacterium]
MPVRIRRKSRLGGLLALFVTIVALIAVSQPASAGTPAVLTPDPGSMSFGNVRVGTLMIDILSIQNTGGSSITLHSANNAGGAVNDFAGATGIDPSTFSPDSDFDCLKAPDGVSDRVLAPGNTCAFIIITLPTGAGPRNTTFELRDSADTVRLEVPLSVNGTEGYYISGALGEVAHFGDAKPYGDATTINLNAPIVDIQQVPFGEGFWLLGLDGGVFSYPTDDSQDAHFLGSTGGMNLNAPVVSMSPRSSDGYYLAGLDGGVFNYGPDAPFHGSMGGQDLNAPVIGISVNPQRDGYWLAGTDGGVFAFEDAGFHGSRGGQPLNAPIVGMAPTPTGDGYWLVGEDGGVFNYGDAGFFGSMGGMKLNAPIVDFAPSPTGFGYWMLGLDGGVFAFGDAAFQGNLLGNNNATGITGTAPPLAFPLDGTYFSVNEVAGGPIVAQRKTFVSKASKAPRARRSR